MKTAIAILMMSVALLVSCSDECDEMKKYHQYEQELQDTRDQIEVKELEIQKLIDEGTPFEDLVVEYDELTDLQITEAILEIEMEDLKNKSRCI